MYQQRVMGKYGTELTRGGDMRCAMFVQMYLQLIIGKGGSKLTVPPKSYIRAFKAEQTAHFCLTSAKVAQFETFG